MEGLKHFVVFYLESAHDVSAADYQVHHTGYELALRVPFGLTAQRYYVHEVHESEELLVTLLMAFEELERELLFQI